MVSRSAYDQLNYSPLLLAGTVAGMLLDLPSAAALGDIWHRRLRRRSGAVTWGLMTLAFLPIVRFYRLSPLWAAALPVIAGSLYGIHARFGSAALAWQGRALERARAGAPRGGIMTTGPVWDPGEKTHRDENFPVASHLVSKKHRAVDPRLLPIRARRRRHRGRPGAFRKREDPQARRLRGYASRENRRYRRCAAAARGDCGARAFAPSMARICSSPSAWTRASTATPIGTS